MGCEKVNGYLRSRVQINLLKLLRIPNDHTPQPIGTMEKDCSINFSSILEKNFWKNWSGERWYNSVK